MQLTDMVKDKTILRQKTATHQWPYWIILWTLSLGATFQLLV